MAIRRLQAHQEGSEYNEMTERNDVDQALYIWNMCLVAPLTSFYGNMSILAIQLFAAILNSTTLLIGPAQQMRMMLDDVRVYATDVYVGCVFLALICALLIHSKILTIIAILCEICALIWYSLSYVPFA